MERQGWKFEFAASKLAEAAQAKIDWHTERIESLKNAINGEDDQDVEFKEPSYVEVDKMSSEELSELMERRNEHSRKNLDSMLEKMRNIDSENRRNEERRKEIKVYMQLINEYRTWHQILSASLQAQLILDIDDWLFFFGTNDAEVEVN